MPVGDIIYAGLPETIMYKEKTGNKKVNTLLHGSGMKILDDNDPDWYKVESFKDTGWVRKAQTRSDCGLKMFFIDVGQGDSCLIETPKHKILIDAGRWSNVERYFNHWKYKWVIDDKKKVHFDAVILTHFDIDHYGGIINILNDTNYTFDTVYHNGIIRFNDKKSQRPQHLDTEIGQTDSGGQRGVERNYLMTSFDDINSVNQLIIDDNNDQRLSRTFRNFLDALICAYNGGRLKKVQRLTSADGYLPKSQTGDDLEIKVLGPVLIPVNGIDYHRWMTDESHTINGNSIVLKLKYINRQIMMGGDLNTEAEDHLLYHWGCQEFEVDVAKACHHGSSEFTVDFLRAVNPYATVISSGDNETYSHPKPDALGSAGRYSKGIRPAVFSTELARSTNDSREIHYGLINLRSDGKMMMLSQMYECKRKTDMWDSYILP